MNSQWVALIVLLLYVMALMVKVSEVQWQIACRNVYFIRHSHLQAYFIGVIWACYQYLHLRSVSIVTYHLEHDGEVLSAVGAGSH